MKFKLWTLFLAYFVYDFLNKRLQDFLMLDLDITRSFENNISILLLFSQIAIFFLYSLITYTGFFYFYPAKKWSLCILFIILGFTVPIGVRFLIEEVLFDVLFGFTNYFQKVSFNFYVRDNSIYALKYAPFGIAFFFIRYTLYNEKNAKQLSQLNHEMELSLLRSQINPHFLLNSLNSVYSLVYQKSEKALEAIDKLSSLLKYTLYENSELVTVSKELENLDKIIELQKIRMGFDTPILLEIEEAALSNKIPPFVLMSVVENAFKHGEFRNESTPLIIQLNQVQNQLVLYSENKKASQEKDAIGGIGLQNIRKRLELLFPNQSSFEIQESNTTFKIKINFPLI